MLTCATCGSEEPEGSRFCGSCAAPFAAADPQPIGTATIGEDTLPCPTCGSEEPAGSRFCGSCGTPLAGSGPPPPPEEPARPATVKESPAIEPLPVASTPPRRLPWIAAGAVVVLLVAGGVAAAFLLRSDGDSSSEVIPTPTLTQPASTSEDALTPSPRPTLAERIAPSLQALTASQDTLDDRLRSLTAGVQSFAELRRAAATLAASLVQTQHVVDGLTPGDAGDGKLSRSSVARSRPTLRTQTRS